MEKIILKSLKNKSDYIDSEEYLVVADRKLKGLYPDIFPDNTMFIEGGECAKTLYEEYGVVPDHYEYIGNDVYQVYVKIDDKIVPYVVVNWKTGDFHG